MNKAISLRDLAATDSVEPPYGYEEFEHRRVAAVQRHRTGVWSVAASVAVLGLVASLALVTQVQNPVARLSGAAAGHGTATVVEAPYQPALVDVGQFEVTSELEDHIALLDAQISAARVYQASPERLRQMEAAREQLNDSLQRVSYAQTLLGF
jgi:hypothetical protein